MKNGPFQFKLWYLLAVVLIVGLAVGVSYFKNASTDENSQPPSLKIGSVLLKGQAVKNGLVKYDDADKDKSNKANYGAKVSANVNKGVGFYYTDEDMTLDKLLDSSQCLNANVGRTLFFSYSPGGEPGAEKAGFYVYPEVLASGENSGIADSSKYLIKKGRVFGLYSDNPVTGHCFKDAETKANIVPDFGALKNGWVQIAAKDNKLSAILEPVKDCVNSVWVQDGIDSFDTKIPKENYASHNLQKYNLLWLELKNCGAVTNVPPEGGNAQTEGLTATDIAGMTPVLSQEFQANGKTKLTWTKTNENVKGNALQGYQLEFVGASSPYDKQPDFFYGKGVTESELTIQKGETQKLRICAKYQNPLVVAEYCSNEVLAKGAAKSADAQPEGLTAADIVGMTPVLSQSSAENNFIKLSWTAVSENVKGNTLQHYVLETVAMPEPLIIQKNKTETELKVASGKSYAVKVCAKYETPLAVAKYCSNELTLIGPVAVADPGVVISDAVLVKNKIEADKPDAELLAVKLLSDRDMFVTFVTVTIGGTGDPSHLGNNFQLKNVNGNVLATANRSGNKLVFNVMNYKVDKGSTVFKLVADVKDSATAGEVFKFSIESASDIKFTDFTIPSGSFPIVQTVTVKADTKPGIVQNLKVETAPLWGDTFGNLKGKAKLFWNPVVYPAGSIKFYEVWYGSDFSDKLKYQSTTFVNNSYGVEMDLEDGKYWFMVRAIGGIEGVEYKGGFSDEVVGTVR